MKGRLGPGMMIAVDLINGQVGWSMGCPNLGYSFLTDSYSFCFDNTTGDTTL